MTSRYRIEGGVELVGQARIEQALDSDSGQVVGIRRMSPRDRDDPAARRRAYVQLEREFLILSQLEHPNLARVFDFGVDEEGPFYTLEWLAGGSLAQRCPLPWQTVCERLSGIAWALSAVHARGFVFRSVTTQSIRYDEAGTPKLSDFSLLAPMGVPTDVCGEAPFIAPEALHLRELDGRTDLFALGAVLYFALTGRHAYRAPDLGSLRDRWRSTPPPADRAAGNAPPELGRLIDRLVNPSQSTRIATAQRVAELLEALERGQSAPDSWPVGASLNAPALVGRSAEVQTVRRRIIRAAQGRGSAILVRGPSGTGRSRLLDAAVLEGRLLGLQVLRAEPPAAPQPWSVGRQIIQGLLAARADLSALRKRGPIADFLNAGQDPGRGALRDPRGEWSDVLCKAVVAASDSTPTVIVVDDLERVDRPSLSFLTHLSTHAERAHIVLIAAYDTDAGNGLAGALSLWREVARAVDVLPLGENQSHELLACVFGDAPATQATLDRIGSALHDGSAGYPRDLLCTVRGLIARGLLHWDEEGLQAAPVAELQAAIEAHHDVQARLTQLDERARAVFRYLLVDDHALLDLDDLSALLGEPRLTVHRHVLELCDQGLLRPAPAGVRLAQALWSSHAGEPEGVLAEAHRRIGQRLEQRSAPPIAIASHYVAGGEPERARPAIEALLTRLEAERDGGSGERIDDLVATDPLARVELLERMLAAAEARDWPRGVIVRYRSGLCQCAALCCEWDRVARQAPILIAELRELAQPAAMLGDVGAFVEPAEPRATGPKPDRDPQPQAALDALAEALALLARAALSRGEPELLTGLPAQLPDERWPRAIQVATAICRGVELALMGKHLDARDQLVGQHDRLRADGEGLSLRTRRTLELTMAGMLAGMHATWGRRSALSLAQRLQSSDPHTSERIRLVYQLAVGDLREVKRARTRLVLLHVRSSRGRRPDFEQQRVQLMFQTLAGDQAALARSYEELSAIANPTAALRTLTHLAEAAVARTRGAPNEALALLETLEQNLPTTTTRLAQICWLHMDLLLDSGRFEQARAFGMRQLGVLRQEGRPTFGVRCRLSLSLGHMGFAAAAQVQLQAAFEELASLRARGLHLGFAHEVGARLALLRGDMDHYEAHMLELGPLYRQGKWPALIARVEGLALDARERDAMEGEETVTAMEPTTMEARPTTLRPRGVLPSGRPPNGADFRAVLSPTLGQTGARAGHLYVAREGGLTRVSSHSDSMPPPALDERVARYFSAQVDAADDAAADLSDAGFACYLLQHADTHRSLTSGVLVLRQLGPRVVPPPAPDLEQLSAALATLDDTRPLHLPSGASSVEDTTGSG